MSGFLSGVCVCVGDKSLVECVSATLEPGITALVGPSGAGKSTLLKAIGGVMDFKGDIVLGRSLRELSPQEQALQRAWVPQTTHLPFAYTALDVVAMGRLPHDDAEPGARRLAADILASLDMDGLANRLFPTLSGGEKARVMVARALAQLHGVRGGWLLLDEPTSALDIANSMLLMDVVARATKSLDLHTLVVLHDLNLAAQYADSIWMMSHGRLLLKGSPNDVLTPDAIYMGFGVHAQILRGPDQIPAVFPIRNLERSHDVVAS